MKTKKRIELGVGFESSVLILEKGHLFEREFEVLLKRERGRRRRCCCYYDEWILFCHQSVFTILATFNHMSVSRARPEVLRVHAVDAQPHRFVSTTQPLLN
jgi:hypothetical protein